MGFSRQGYWGGLPFPSSGDHPGPGVELTCPALALEFLAIKPPAFLIHLKGL